MSSKQPIEWKITSDQSGCKLIDFLRAAFPSFSAKKIKLFLEKNCCHINGRIERFPSTYLGTGDLVSFSLASMEDSYCAPSATGAEPVILFSDDYLVVVDKPVGVTWESKQFIRQLIACHRLDKETTGVWLLARNKQAAQLCEALFRKRQIEKEYIALVDGWPKKEKGTIENFLAPLHSYQGQVVWGAAKVGDKGVAAHTEWKVIERYGSSSEMGCSKVRCRPLTGRTHQIRVHLSSIGHPILGDWHYAKSFRCKRQVSRCLLHAFSLAFTHPITGEKLMIEAALPADFSF